MSNTLKLKHGNSPDQLKSGCRGNINTKFHRLNGSVIEVG